jgi:GxxExxY protein
MIYHELTEGVIGAAMKVHTDLGPGLLESVYQRCLAIELRMRGYEVTEQAPVRIIYQGVDAGPGLRLDLLVNDTLIVELKAVDALLPVHRAQLISYLRLSGKPVGLLINFNVVNLRDGIVRCTPGPTPSSP